MRLGIAILNTGAIHILDFWVRVIPQPSGAAILNSGVPMAPNLRSGRKHEIMRMIPISWKISKSGSTAVRAQSLAFYATLRDSEMRGDEPQVWIPRWIPCIYLHACGQLTPKGWVVTGEVLNSPLAARLGP